MASAIKNLARMTGRRFGRLLVWLFMRCLVSSLTPRKQGYVPGCLVAFVLLGVMAFFLAAAIYDFNPSDYLRPLFALLLLLFLGFFLIGWVFGILFGKR